MLPLASLTPMRELVALDIPASNNLIDVIRRIWERGDGFAPIDQRLPKKAKASFIKALKPSLIIDSSGSQINVPNGKPLADGQCLAMATSGTTGDPKIVVYTMDQVVASAKATSTYVGVSSSDKWLCCLPVAHIGGLSVILRSLVMGNEVIVQPKFNAELLLDSVSKGATLVSLVPTALQMINPTIFRRIVLGGSAPPKFLPSNVMVTYGLTETGSGVVYDGNPLPGLEIKISKTGEILLKGPMLATYYRNDEPILDQLGWFHTKDAGRLNEDGTLEVLGRMDETINTGGEKVFPATLEALLSTHPKIDKVAVVGLKDKKWGEAVTAVIVPKPDVGLPTLEELRELTKEEFPAFYAPTRLEIVKELPTTALGKIRKTYLKVQLNADSNL